MPLERELGTGPWPRRAAVLFALVGSVACGGPPPQVDDVQATEEEAPSTAGTAPDRVRPERIDSELTRGDTLPGHPSWTAQDYEILRRTTAWARSNGIDSLAVGERIARIGETFLGTPYVPQTLDPPGPERLVVNLRGLDCVTYVENMMALAHFVRLAPARVVDEPDRAMDLYEGLLRAIRYRGGELDGYPSRLHYFSEWIADNGARGNVRDVTAELGGVPDMEAPVFMTRHRNAYRQLADPAVYDAIETIEEGLAARPRYYISQERVSDLQSGIRTGDIIAATSTLDGLDVAHTGIAVWKDGVLRLMHAPLVGDVVQLSEAPLAERLLGISRQDGIIVARPSEGVNPPPGSLAPGG